jgi:nitroimidazol reductase NimA-like FMN-containing flavoprotein (pyridoxamine 5'-phosphate oxidase superfamily)
MIVLWYLYIKKMEIVQSNRYTDRTIFGSAWFIPAPYQCHRALRQIADAANAGDDQEFRAFLIGVRHASCLFIC